ncbi:MAG: hypothetical protein ACJAZM_003025 [Cyclobacteriaceae bacterium]
MLIQLSINSMEKLEKNQLERINGGIFGWDDVLVGLAITAGAQIIADWDNFKAGLAGKPPVN